MSMPVGRENPIWALQFCRDHFQLSQDEMVQIGTSKGWRRLQYLWEREHNGLYESPLYLLRQEWYHMVVGEDVAFPEFWEALDKQSVVLDFGCGTAEYARSPWIEQKGTYVGIEPSLMARHYLSAKYQGYPGFHLYEQLVSHDRVDAILCLDVLEHIPDPIVVTEDLLEHLEPGGNALFLFSNKWPHPGHLIESIDQSDQWVDWMKTHMEFVGRHEKGPLWFRKPMTS